MEINIVTSRARVWIEISRRNPVLAVMYVTSRARVWIEITSTAGILVQFKVTSRARVWIEMYTPPSTGLVMQSLLVRGCGLK